MVNITRQSDSNLAEDDLQNVMSHKGAKFHSKFGRGRRPYRPYKVETVPMVGIKGLTIKIEIMRTIHCYLSIHCHFNKLFVI